MAAIDRAIGIERPKDAAVVVHDDVGIFPLAAKFDAWTVVGGKVAKEGWPVVHIKTDLFSIGIGADAAPHASAKMHAENFASGGTDIPTSTN